MSRSVKKTRILGNTGDRSEKKDKRTANRCLRRSVNIYLEGHNDPEATVPPLLREVSSVWGFAKDGKSWVNSDEAWTKYRRK